MTKKLKKPSDYAQFYCRINDEDKNEIDNMIERILQLQMAMKEDGDLLPKRNDLIVIALKRGLSKIEKELSKY